MEEKPWKVAGVMDGSRLAPAMRHLLHLEKYKGLHMKKRGVGSSFSCNTRVNNFGNNFSFRFLIKCIR